jgi:hypothetical protein
MKHDYLNFVGKKQFLVDPIDESISAEEIVQ